MSERPMCEVPIAVQSAASEEFISFLTVRRTMAAASVAAIALIGPSLSPGEATPPKSTPEPRLHIPGSLPLPPENLFQAPTKVSAETKEYVKDLFAQPETGQYKDALAIVQQEKFARTLSSKLNPNDYDAVDYYYNDAIADDFGLHIASPLAARAALEQLDQADASFEERAAVAKRYLSKLGVGLEVADAKDDLALKFKPLSQKEKQAPAVKNVPLQLVEAFSVAPREYYDFIRQEGKLTVVLADNTDTEYKNDKGEVIGTYSAYANVDSGEKKITFGANNGVSTETTSHEIVHHIDPLLSGGAGATQNDPAYTELNNGVIYQNNGAEHQYVADSTAIGEVYNRWGPEIYEARGAGDFKTACLLAKESDADMAAHEEGWVFISDYAGQQNAAEDKAEVGSGLTNITSINQRLNLNAPSVYKKFMLYTERFAQYAPKVVGYFVTRATARNAANTYQIDPLTPECDQPIPR